MTRTIGSSRTWTAWLPAAVVLLSMWTAAVAFAQTEPAGNADAQSNAKAEGETSLRVDSSNTPPEAAAEEDLIPTMDLWDMILKGGYLMIPIAVCSFILVMFVMERAISLRRGRVIPGPFVTRFLQQLRGGEIDRNQALELCADSDSPVAEVFAGAVRKWGRPAVEVEQAIIDSGERATNGLRRYLRVINGVATVAPLLGLLGTVVGMIRAFNDIATFEAMGRPELLAGGISEALLTTAFGLSVAIPALICYLFFVGRVDKLIIDIDALGLEVVAVISAEELLEQETGAPNSSPDSRRESAA